MVPPVFLPGRRIQKRLAACMTAAVAGLVGMEFFGVTIPSGARLVARVRIVAFVAMVRVEAVVDMAVEVSGAMEPWSGSDEGAAGEPLGAVVAVGGAAIGLDVVVAVRAGWRDTNGYADLGLGLGRGCYKETQTSDCRYCKDFQTAHCFTSAC